MATPTIIRRTLVALGLALSVCCATAVQASVLVYTATLSGANASPPNGSPGTGTTTVTIDTALNNMSVTILFSGLTAGTTASHIHAPTAVPFIAPAAVATQLPTFTGFPLGVTSGTYTSTFDLLSTSTYNPAFVTANGATAAGAEAALLSALAGGRAYLNIHTTAFPGGEISGFLVAVPEPRAWAMMLLGLGAIGLAIRREPRKISATP